MQSRISQKTAVVVPEYAGSGADVTIEVVVDTGGKVVCIDNARGHPLLVGPAIQAVSKWQFKPLVDKLGKETVFYGDLRVRVENQYRR
jgi:hypothetical protein